MTCLPMLSDLTPEERQRWVERLQAEDEPIGCTVCGMIAGSCEQYPCCPGNPQWTPPT